MEAYADQIRDTGAFEDSRQLVTHLIREGRATEAREAIRELVLSDSDRRVWAANNLAILERQEKDFAKALMIHLGVAPLLNEVTNPEIKGRHYLGLAITLEEIANRERIESYFDRALVELEAARYYLTKAGCPGMVGTVENNIGNLLIQIGRPLDSHSHLEQAREMYKSSGRDDLVYRIAEVDNTEAEAYLAEDNPQEAIHFSMRSVDALRYGDEPKTLAISLHTLELCRRALNDHTSMVLTGAALREAGSVAKAAEQLGISRTAVEKRIKAHPELEIYAHRGKPRGIHAHKE